MSQTANKTAAADQYSEAEINQMLQPFDDQYVAQFAETLQSRGYTPESKDEFARMLKSASVLMDKVANGEIPSPFVEDTPSANSQALDKLASLLGEESGAKANDRQLIESMHSKAASYAQDPVTLFSAGVLSSLAAGENN